MRKPAVLQMSEDGWGSGLEQAATWMLFFVDNFCCSCLFKRFLTPLNHHYKPVSLGYISTCSSALECSADIFHLFFFCCFSVVLFWIFFVLFFLVAILIFKNETRNSRICCNLFFFFFLIS